MSRPALVGGYKFATKMDEQDKQELAQLEQEAAQQDAGADTSVEESPADEPKTVDESVETEAEAEPTGDAEVEGKTEGVQTQVKKRSAEGRIQELVREKKQEAERAATLEQKLKELTNTGRYTDAQGAYPKDPMADINVEPGKELTVEDYKRDVATVAQNITRIELEKERMLSRIDREALEVLADYPELNDKSEVYDKELSETVTETVYELIKTNPNLSVKATVAKLMKPYKRVSQKAAAEASEEATRQVASAAMRPTTMTPAQAEKSDDDLSLEEIEAKVGVVRNY